MWVDFLLYRTSLLYVFHSLEWSLEYFRLASRKPGVLVVFMRRIKLIQGQLEESRVKSEKMPSAKTQVYIYNVIGRGYKS